MVATHGRAAHHRSRDRQGAVHDRLDHLSFGGRYFFRFGKQLFDELSKDPKPWKRVPLAYLSPVDQDDKEAVQEQQELVERATSPSKPEWWVYAHHCQLLNGYLLVQLLRRCMPNKTFRVAQTAVHTWVVCEQGKNYDLYWPYVGIDSLQTALFDAQGTPFAVTYGRLVDPATLEVGNSDNKKDE
jgi:hypothetical protein